MDETRRKAFDFASDTTKQLLVLATGIITLTITFSKDFVGVATVLPMTRKILVFAWGFLLISVPLGIWTLLALTGTLEKAEPEAGDPSISGMNVRVPAFLQILTFVIGLALTVWFGMRALDP